MITHKKKIYLLKFLLLCWLETKFKNESLIIEVFKDKKSAIWRYVIKVSTISVVTKSIIFTIVFIVIGFTTTLITIFFNSTDNIVDTKKHACCFNWCLKCLEFNCYWIPNFFFLHVCNFSGIAVNSIHEASFNGVFCS